MNRRRSSPRPSACGFGSRSRATRAGKEFRYLGRIEVQAFQHRTLIDLRELDVSSGLAQPLTNTTSPPGPLSTSKATCPWRWPRRAIWSKQGNRVAFFATSIGELERLGDVLQEYSVPYQLGIESAGGSRGLSRTRIPAGAVASTYLMKGQCAARRHASRVADLAILVPRICFIPPIWSRASQPESQLAAFAADIADLKPGDYRRARDARRGPLCRHSRNCRRAIKRAISCCSSTPATPSSMFR